MDGAQNNVQSLCAHVIRFQSLSIIASEGSSVTNCANLIASEASSVTNFASEASAVIGASLSEPHTYRTAGKNLRHIYIILYVLLASERSERASLLSCKLRFEIYIYIYIYIFSYVCQNFDLRMLSFTRIARGNFRTLPVFYL